MSVIYYVGTDGSNSNDGLTWATRKLTIQAAVTLSTLPGTTIYVAPGTYPELVTLGSSGTSGSPISLIGDVDGSHTSGTAGPVRITGSNNNRTATRANCIVATSRAYWTLRGLSFDTTSNYLLNLTTVNHFTIQKCWFQDTQFWISAIQFGTTGENAANVVQQCWFLGTDGVTFNGSPLNSACVVESSVFLGSGALHDYACGGVTLRNCTILGGTDDNMVTVDSAFTTDSPGKQ